MSGKSIKSHRPPLGVFALITLNLAIICTLRGLPIMAEEGLSLIFYFIVTTIIFLIPIALVSAELSTGWPPYGPGGVYIWVKEAFGPRLGFIAVWLQWVQNVIWFPTILSFAGATIAYVYDPSLAANKYFMIAVIFTVYWGATFMNFRGLKVSGFISMICVIAGTVLPGVIIILLGLSWYFSGEPPAITVSFDKLIPDMSHMRNIVFLAGAVLIMSGIEVSAAHAHEVRNPKKTFPLAIFIAAGISLILLMLGSLSIAIVVPQEKLSLVAGIMETFELFFAAHGIKKLIPIVALLITAGSVGEIIAWIIGPAKGLMITAEDGYLPRILRKINERNVPTNILLAQGIIITLLALIFLLMPTVSSSYWILSAFSILLYLIMYIIVFAAAIYLRYSQPDTPRAYKIPGGKIGIWFVAGLGIIGSLFTLLVSIFPPAQIDTGSVVFYETFLIGGSVITCLIPLLIVFLETLNRRKK